MNNLIKSVAGAAAISTVATIAMADEINLRIGSGHPPGVVYAGLMILFPVFATWLPSRI